jgi:CheY-like chemotaxis protein
MTRQLLAIGRQSLLTPRVVSLQATVREHMALIGQVASDRVSVVVDVPPDLPAVRIDPDQFGRVLVNLTANARDAMPAGGVLHITATPEAFDESRAATANVPPGPYVRLDVTDTGEGMTADVQRRIFEPFFTTKAPQKGTGLGLAVVEGIARQSGWAIAVVSTVGQGTTFSVHVPVAGEAAPGAMPDLLRPAPRGDETVLVVEDVAPVRSVVLTILTGLGYEVVMTASGAEALEAFHGRSHEIDLVLCDVAMPVMRGPDLVAALRAAKPRLAVLFMSGHSSDTAFRESVAAGAEAFLQKPFTALELATSVRHALDAR